MSQCLSLSAIHPLAFSLFSPAAPVMRTRLGAVILRQRERKKRRPEVKAKKEEKRREIVVFIVVGDSLFFLFFFLPLALARSLARSGALSHRAPLSLPPFPR